MKIYPELFTITDDKDLKFSFDPTYVVCMVPHEREQEVAKNIGGGMYWLLNVQLFNKPNHAERGALAEKQFAVNMQLNFRSLTRLNDATRSIEEAHKVAVEFINSNP